MTVSQFRRALNALQISSLGRLWLVEPEVDALIALYKDPDDPDRVCWRIFEDDINHGTMSYTLDSNLQSLQYPQTVMNTCFLF